MNSGSSKAGCAPALLEHHLGSPGELLVTWPLAWGHHSLSSNLHVTDIGLWEQLVAVLKPRVQ